MARKKKIIRKVEDSLFKYSTLSLIKLLMNPTPVRYNDICRFCHGKSIFSKVKLFENWGLIEHIKPYFTVTPKGKQIFYRYLEVEELLESVKIRTSVPTKRKKTYNNKRRV
jgi:hypothetical protein